MEAAQLFKQAPNPRIPKFSPGDTVRVNFRIREGERERIQAFQGVVIRFMNGKGPAANFTVRRITAGIGIDAAPHVGQDIVHVQRSSIGGKVDGMRIEIGKIERRIDW